LAPCIPLSLPLSLSQLVLLPFWPRVYGKIAVVDFFSWFCGIAGLLAITTLSLVVQAFLPISRPNAAWVGIAVGIFLGGAMLAGIPDMFGKLNGHELKPFEFYRVRCPPSPLPVPVPVPSDQ